MQFPTSLARGCAALALLCACGAEATTPSLLWADAHRVAVNCLVQSNSGSDQALALEKLICARVQALASHDAPLPIEHAETGDPALIAADTVTLLVHASVERSPRGRAVAFTIRPYRAAEGGADILFGTAPKVVELASGGLDPALDSALREALAEILPWQRPSGLIARPL